jgi:hypothetical protein
VTEFKKGDHCQTACHSLASASVWHDASSMSNKFSKSVELVRPRIEFVSSNEKSSRRARISSDDFQRSGDEVVDSLFDVF